MKRLLTLLVIPASAHLRSGLPSFHPVDDPILDGRGKPDPTIFLEAAKLLGLTSEADKAATLVFEDGVPGVRAAAAAGMQCVWIPDAMLVQTLAGEELEGLRPTQQLANAEEFGPEEWGLPPYGN